MALRGRGINRIAFNRAITEGATKSGRGVLYKKIKEESLKRAELEKNKKQNDYAKAFLAHPITKDVKDGPDSEGGNTAGCLGSEKGNLFSFLGFDRGTDPTVEIESAIRQSCKIKRTTYKLNVHFSGKTLTTYNVQIDMSYPTVEDLKRLPDADLPRQPGSWLDKIEKNISGLGAYFFAKRGFSSQASKSGHAIQLANWDKGTRFKPRDYFKEIIKQVFPKSKKR